MNSTVKRVPFPKGKRSACVRQLVSVRTNTHRLRSSLLIPVDRLTFLATGDSDVSHRRVCLRKATSHDEPANTSRGEGQEHCGNSLNYIVPMFDLAMWSASASRRSGKAIAENQGRHILVSKRAVPAARSPSPLPREGWKQSNAAQWAARMPPFGTGPLLDAHAWPPTDGHLYVIRAEASDG
jgi:hypothetical protein